MRNVKKKLLCLVLALALALPLFAVAEPDDAIHIRTASDLARLAEESVMDTWSTGVTVVLDDDISLDGDDFVPIPFFDGVFDGQGHGVYHLSITETRSPSGLFRETGPHAVIRDLRVSGTVTPDGDSAVAGGIVGYNRGSVVNCSFSGQVYAEAQAGGVVGLNAATGLVSGCDSAGTVSGLRATGGIVGENLGAVARCENGAYVNTASVDPSVRIDALDTSSVLHLLESTSADKAGIATDTGGVVGANSGAVDDCRNAGAVGYPHLGYNVGGVVGRSDGYVSGCVNYGEINGRRNIGGVVGQAAPYVETEKNAAVATVLAYRVRSLNAAIDAALEDLDGETQSASGHFSAMSDYLRRPKDAIDGADLTDLESLENLTQQVRDSASNVSRELSRTESDAEGDADALRQNIENITRELNALSQTATQAVNLLESGGLVPITDASSADSAIALGKVAACTNEGSVWGDSNIGGIAGGISLEDPREQEEDDGADETVNRQYRLHAVLADCVNRGEITGKRSCAGGVCGKMDLGLAVRCQAYGPVSLEEGDYAGGICGLSYGEVSSCWGKCVVSAQRYVGGIVGNGDAGQGEREASRVADCGVITELDPQTPFSGAISGGGDGVYENNRFVSDTCAGLNHRSVRGVAEPVAFEAFSALPGVPEECTVFALRFVVDDETVKTVAFDYGASFDRSVFPAVEKRDNAYPVWDRTDLTDLHFDTTVTAEYRSSAMVLPGDLTRSNGRCALYVEGQFQEGDTVTVEALPVLADDLRFFRGTWHKTLREQADSVFVAHRPDFSLCVAVAEELRVQIPDDGLREHTVRYLTPSGATRNYRLYVYTDNGWERLSPDVFGSYYVFGVSGSEVTVALVETIQSWWVLLWAVTALAVVAAFEWLCVFLVRRWRKKQRPTDGGKKKKPANKKRRVRVAVIAAALVAAAALAFSLGASGKGNALTAYRLLKDLADAETDIQTDITLTTGGGDIALSTVVHRVEEDGRMISCVEQYGVSLYLAQGNVYLENGRAFRLGSDGETTALPLMLEVVKSDALRRETVEGMTFYTADIRGERANRLLRFFAGDQSGLLRCDALTLRLYADESGLERLTVSGSGRLDDSPIVLEAVMCPVPMAERPEIPQAVRQAMESGKAEETFSYDVLALLAAWMKWDSAENVDADIYVQADCGALTLQNDLHYYRTPGDDGDIQCVSGRLFTVYFTPTAACTATGTPLTAAQENVRDAAGIIDEARRFCLSGSPACEDRGSSKFYTVTFSPEDAKSLTESVVPELRDIPMTYDACVLEVSVQNGALSSVTLRCGGTLRVAARDVDTAVTVTVKCAEARPHVVPSPVRAALRAA